ncbi:MAG: acetyl-coenzyme A synthetase N-terminal domain-containing protein, partial [Bacteroidota bacterium]
MNYQEFYRKSIEQPEVFWQEQAENLAWHTPPKTFRLLNTFSIEFLIVHDLDFL